MTPSPLSFIKPASNRHKRMMMSSSAHPSAKKRAKSGRHLDLGKLFGALSSQSSPSACLAKFRSLAKRIKQEDRSCWQLYMLMGNEPSLLINLDQDDYISIRDETNSSVFFCMRIDCANKQGEWTWFSAEPELTGARIKRLALRLSFVLQLEKLTLEDIAAVHLPGAEDDELYLRIFRPILYGAERASYYASAGFRLSPAEDFEAYSAAVNRLQSLTANKIRSSVLKGSPSLQKRFDKVHRKYLADQPNCPLQDLALAIDAERRRALPGSLARLQNGLDFAFLFQRVIGREPQEPLSTLQRQVAEDYALLENTVNYERRLTS